ncbi:hypothetical protein TMUPMC115_2195 [Tetragenococcus muriaticus PMC-11-5]|uniref:Uncharacterized protein n=1 Tax=Tetragenococcus muriaticus PMC-11-5 TaxID=1302649 RepID=A0A091BZS0_9ENTE|nr:hypothetical protein TMUPMC115_2195 [Tetragenococcus muriaticus PMC-11-5]
MTDQLQKLQTEMQELNDQDDLIEKDEPILTKSYLKKRLNLL